MRLAVSAEIHLPDCSRRLEQEHGVDGATAELKVLVALSGGTESERVLLGVSDGKGHTSPGRDRCGAQPAGPTGKQPGITETHQCLVAVMGFGIERLVRRTR